ncbi:hypothetical protein ACFQL0_08020 [Haloplanus litoreus]
MTSTVLDGVFCLLLISAAVVTVTTATPQEPAGAGRAADVASTLATTTATVNYTLTPRPDATGVPLPTNRNAFDRTAHGTLAGLLHGRPSVDCQSTAGGSHTLGAASRVRSFGPSARQFEPTTHGSPPSGNRTRTPRSAGESPSEGTRHRTYRFTPQRLRRRVAFRRNDPPCGRPRGGGHRRSRRRRREGYRRRAVSADANPYRRRGEPRHWSDTGIVSQSTDSASTGTRPSPTAAWTTRTSVSPPDSRTG